jgi:hypothetical protein
VALRLARLPPRADCPSGVAIAWAARLMVAGAAANLGREAEVPCTSVLEIRIASGALDNVEDQPEGILEVDRPRVTAR